MIATFDIGNTNMDVGIFSNETNDETSNNEIIASFKIKVKKSFSKKELKNTISKELNKKDIDKKKINTLLLASVRPSIVPKIKEMLEECFSNSIKEDFIEVNINSNLGLVNKYVGNVGIDRVLGCLAAYKLYNKNAIVVDFGTATTISVIDENGVFYGGVIMSGIYTASENLLKKTELLPFFTLKTSENVLADNTLDGLSNGIFYSNYYAIKGLCQKLAKELNFDDYIVIGTGGNSDIFKNSDLFTYIDKHLVLKGLKFFYNEIKTLF